MACPFFLPHHRLDSEAWNPAPRLPLVDAWSGTCCAPPAGPFEPREDVLRELCNMGYARGRCRYFPADAIADAVRFSASENSAGDPRILFVIEKNHVPIQHGEFDSNTAALPLAAQGRAFLDSHARLRAISVR